MEFPCGACICDVMSVSEKNKLVYSASGECQS
jgi:hypothetical protein